MNVGGDHRSKLKNDEKTRLISWVDEKATVTLKCLASKIYNEFGKTVSKDA
jgi:transposase